MAELRILVAALLFAMTIVVANGQEKPHLPLELSITIEKVDACSEKTLKLNASLLNVSPNGILIDKKGLGDVMMISVARFESGGFISIHRTIINDHGRSDIPDFLLIEPEDTYEDLLEISLDDSFFELPGEYRLRIGYRQFRTDPYQDKELWFGAVYAEPISISLHPCL
jgi:hypothetical protein